MTTLPWKHVIESQQFDRKLLETVFQVADQMKEDLAGDRKFAKALDGKIMASLFYESSTRTRFSFESSMLRLGGSVITTENAREFGSAAKGETLSDSTKIMNGYADVIVMRHNEAGSAARAAEVSDIPIINAGDGAGQHPTQALLDALTIMQEKDSLEGLTVSICGDVAHSRVANSNAILLSKMGANVRFVAPEVLMPNKIPAEGIECFDNLEDGIKDADVVMMLRIQKERMDKGTIPSDAAYFNKYGLTMERLSYAKPDALVLHPGPMNRGVEIDDEVADDPTRSLMKKQVSNGIPTRMAVLDMLIGG